jgi:hypothetical protein
MAAAGATAAAIANAIKASGVLVLLSPEEFVKILARAREPVVVVAEGGLFSRKFHYLMSYKGLAFFAKSNDPLQLPGGVEVVQARSISIPG